MISGVTDGDASEADGTGQDQRLQPRARQLRAAHCQHAVEPGSDPSSPLDSDDQLLTAIRCPILFQRSAL